MEKNNYEKNYHLNKHNFLYENPLYYDVKAVISLIDYFKGIKINSKVLEYGCGLGQNIYLIKNSVGYDVSKFAVDFCVNRRGINAVRNKKKLRNKFFDIVLSCEVLEHLENPKRALEEIKSKLKKGGKLILILPIDKWNKPNLKDVNQHLYNWNFNTITNLLIRVGFYPVEFKIIRRTGFKKLLPISEINLSFYLFLTKIIAIFTGSKHMKIIAVKK